MGWREERPCVDKRYDDFAEIKKFKDTYKGGSALIVLGGPSVKDFDMFEARGKYDVIMCVNGGIKSFGKYSDFWMCVEALDDDYDMDLVEGEVYGHKLVNFKIWHRFKDKTRMLAVRRGTRIRKLELWEPREYTIGLILGRDMQNTQYVNYPQPVGTVGLQCLHWAGILGCTKIDTVGWDLCFKYGLHHGYTYPPITTENRFWGKSMFITKYGLDTMWYWIETADVLIEVKKRLALFNIHWTDHSNGLLQAMGIQ